MLSSLNPFNLARQGASYAGSLVGYAGSVVLSAAQKGREAVGYVAGKAIAGAYGAARYVNQQIIQPQISQKVTDFVQNKIDQGLDGFNLDQVLQKNTPFPRIIRKGLCDRFKEEVATQNVKKVAQVIFYSCTKVLKHIGNIQESADPSGEFLRAVGVTSSGQEFIKNAKARVSRNLADYLKQKHDHKLKTLVGLAWINEKIMHFFFSLANYLFTESVLHRLEEDSFDQKKENGFDEKNQGVLENICKFFTEKGIPLSEDEKISVKTLLETYGKYAYWYLLLEITGGLCAIRQNTKAPDVDETWKQLIAQPLLKPVLGKLAALTDHNASEVGMQSIAWLTGATTADGMQKIVGGVKISQIIENTAPTLQQAATPQS